MASSSSAPDRSGSDGARERPGMVVSDVRFDNEAAWIRKHGGRIIHVIRPDTKAVEAHASEDGIEMQDTDARLFNSGTLEELQLSVRELLRVYD